MNKWIITYMQIFDLKNYPRISIYIALNNNIGYMTIKLKSYMTQLCFRQLREYELFKSMYFDRLRDKAIFDHFDIFTGYVEVPLKDVLPILQECFIEEDYLQIQRKLFEVL